MIRKNFILFFFFVCGKKNKLKKKVFENQWWAYLCRVFRHYKLNFVFPIGVFLGTKIKIPPL